MIDLELRYDESIPRGPCIRGISTAETGEISCLAFLGVFINNQSSCPVMHKGGFALRVCIASGLFRGSTNVSRCSVFYLVDEVHLYD